MFGLPDQAIGAILAAIIAGAVALLGLIISKEQKVSEFRQQWIDALREDIAAVIRYGHCMCSYRSIAQKPGENPWDKINQEYAGLTEALARIRLRLNQREQESLVLLVALNKDLAAVKKVMTNDDRSLDSDMTAVMSASDELVAAAQVVLKQEWVRVRSGERVYRIARWAALLVIIALIAALLYHLFRK
jgi:hypothetical protein